MSIPIPRSFGNSQFSRKGPGSTFRLPENNNCRFPVITYAATDTGSRHQAVAAQTPIINLDKFYISGVKGRALGAGVDEKFNAVTYEQPRKHNISPDKRARQTSGS